MSALARQTSVSESILTVQHDATAGKTLAKGGSDADQRSSD